MTLGDLGMYTEAVLLLSWTVTLYRDMHRDKPRVFVPYLACSLHFLGMYRLKLGQYSAAVVAGTEATTLYRQVHATAMGHDIAADLGMALMIHSCALRQMGQIHREEALSNCGEALSIFHRLVHSREDLNTELAMVLVTQARHFDNAERFDQALEYGQEAVDLLSPSDDDTDNHAQIQLAGALCSHAFHLWRACRSLDCIEVNKKAMALYRVL
ncbi:hypothetical protein SCP_0407870 [Sparassis crispa]|uniref:MalT-like TPR region domain-containing protein n=1 Tax=Sparassis crispa TaxID=139825 RepID=A0A401GJS5_9APHY|nr:hypothetical protein SCP_0407870 [Sparassis crispa]GBE82403.1 hypothetical protein SCP_0407870 [Sparassis crispa]